MTFRMSSLTTQQRLVALLVAVTCVVPAINSCTNHYKPFWVANALAEANGDPVEKFQVTSARDACVHYQVKQCKEVPGQSGVRAYEGQRGALHIRVLATASGRVIYDRHILQTP